MTSGAALIPPRGAWPALALALGLDLVIFLGIAAHWPQYLSDYRHNKNPDAHHYVLLGRNVYQHGSYSRSENAPFVQDMLRTPVYPLFAGGLDLLGGAVAIYLVQVLLHLGSCWLLFLLVQEMAGRRAAIIASLLLATDLVVVTACFEAMSEVLFLILLLASCVCWLPEASVPSRRRDLAGGVLLGLAILTRPAALYLPVLISAIFLCRGSARRVLYLVTPVALLLGLWVVRNAVVCGLPRLTTIDTYNMVYFVGAGAYQIEHDLTLEEAQARVAADFDIPPYREAQNHHRFDRDEKTTHDQIRAVRNDVLTRYSASLAKASLLAICKASVAHSATNLADMLKMTWQAPGMGGVVKGESEAFERLSSNPPVLLAAVGWQMLHTAVVLLSAGIGIWLTLRDAKSRATGITLLVLLAYFYLTIALFGLEAFARCRVPVLPFLYSFAGLALSRLLPGKQ